MSYNVFNFQYVRLSTKSDLKTVASLIIDHWKLEKPRLLISVTGEGSQIIKTPKKSRAITNALQNIVKEKGKRLRFNLNAIIIGQVLYQECKFG